MKRILLTPEEWLRLQAVSPEEKERAMKFAAAWVTWYMKRHNLSRDYGPLSDQEMGEAASKALVKTAYAKIFGGKVHWSPKRTLSSQMIYTSYSEIGHIVRDYFAKGKNLSTTMNRLSDNQQVLLERTRDLDRNPNLREFGYHLAREAVKGYPQLLAYINALYEEHDYTGIRKRLGISMRKVMALEEQLLDILEK